MITRKQVFVVQRTKGDGSWIDVDEFLSITIAEHYFRKWCTAATASDFFLVRLISRDIIEEELLLDHVSEK